MTSTTTTTTTSTTTKTTTIKAPCPCCDNPAGAKRVPLILFLERTEKPLVLIRSVDRPQYWIVTHDPARSASDVNEYNLGAEMGTVGGDGRWRWLGGETCLGGSSSSDRIISIEAWSDPVNWDRDQTGGEGIEGAEYGDDD